MQGFCQMLVELSIGTLAEYIEEFSAIELQNNKEAETSMLGISVPTPTGIARVNYLVKKCDLPMTQIELSNGYSLRVAQKHIFQQNGNDIFAKELKVGSAVDHLSGRVEVTKIAEVDNEDCFDIAIDAPHLYYDANGLTHHNTILTAALSLCVESMGRSIVIVPSKSLVTQTETDYRNLQLDVGVFFGDRKEFGHKHTICTWQSLNSLLKNTKNGAAEITIDEFLEGVVCVIGDECHSAKADALKTLLTGVMAHIPVRWGLTGTIPKEDYAKQALLCSLGPVVGKLKASDLQEQGVLANCHVNILQLADYVEYKDYQSELKYLLESEERLTYLANMISNIADTGNTLVLIDRVLPGQILAEKIVGAVFISGATKARDRQEEYDEVAVSDQKILVATYGIAAVGINIPRIFNLVLIEPGKSFVRVIQSIGRGIRKSKDKDFVQIWDFTSTCRFAKRHLTTRKKYYAEAAYPHSVKKIEWK